MLSDGEKNEAERPRQIERMTEGEEGGGRLLLICQEMSESKPALEIPFVPQVG